jgi:hypothetical protein
MHWWETPMTTQRNAGATRSENQPDRDGKTRLDKQTLLEKDTKKYRSVAMALAGPERRITVRLVKQPDRGSARRHTATMASTGQTG